jgi:hypothetical protein
MSIFISGLDLGQTTDPTAHTILEKFGCGKDAQYHVRYLKRYPLGTPYVDIAKDMARIYSSTDYPLRGSVLTVDQTGVGRGVIEMLRTEKVPAIIQPITITSGNKVSERPDGWSVPKKDLVSVMQVVLETKRIKILSTLKEASTLQRELSSFRMQITSSANETFNARQGEHDDLVLATSTAIWWGEVQLNYLAWRPGENPDQTSSMYKFVYQEDRKVRPGEENMRRVR